MTTLISFLGRGRAEPGTGYRKAQYHFDGGFKRNVPFFGMALTEYLQPDRLILVGTAGSMWDVFFEHQGAADETVLPLIDAVREERVTGELLRQNETQLAHKIGRPVSCVLIPYARDTTEQAQILHALSGAVQQGEVVDLDVTHGFRHLPMLSLVAARFLSHVRQVKVRELYYGALEMTPPDGETPVLRLSGMLQMLDWVEALASYEKDGDYGPFAELLGQDGMDPQRANLLHQAAFFERTSNPVKSREKLSSVFESVKAHEGTFGALFRDELVERIRWYRGSNRAEWELSLADAYMARKDYLRASIFLFESFITRAANTRKLNPNDFDQRKEAYDAEKKVSPDVRQLEYLRNALAHGVRPKDEKETRLISEQEKLEATLQKLRKNLFK